MRTIGALIFPGFELLDVFGPMEMFGLLDKEFHIDLVAENAGPKLRATSPSGTARTALPGIARSD